MKKLNLVSFIAILAAFLGLVLLRVTGMTGHIVISLVALAIMLYCTFATKKNWKVPGLEIGYRGLYFIALATGFVMVIAKIGGVISIVHKVAAALFLVAYVVNFVKSK